MTSTFSLPYLFSVAIEGVKVAHPIGKYFVEVAQCLPNAIPIQASAPKPSGLNPKKFLASLLSFFSSLFVRRLDLFSPVLLIHPPRRPYVVAVKLFGRRSSHRASQLHPTFLPRHRPRSLARFVCRGLGRCWVWGWERLDILFLGLGS